MAETEKGSAAGEGTSEARPAGQGGIASDLGARVPPPAAFHVMIKPVGPRCNLACRYCYYLPLLKRYGPSPPLMDAALLERFTRQYIEAQQVPQVDFTWQGGEPTLAGLDFFRRALTYQQRYRRAGMRIHNALQTNGLLLDEAWCCFLKEHDFLVGVSLDGPRAMHDAYRLDRKGGGTFRRVLQGIERLKAQGVEFNLLTAVHAANADYPLEVYTFLRDEVGARYIQFIPVVELAGGKLTPRSVGGRQYGRFLVAVFDAWVRADVGRISVGIFDAALAVALGQRAGLCVLEPTCGDQLVLEHNGDLYCCDHFVRPRHWLGNLGTADLLDLVGREKQRRFGLRKGKLPSPCQRCQVRDFCNGGCPKNRLAPPGSPGALNHLCAGYRLFFTHARGPLSKMAALLRMGRSPAEVAKLLPAAAERDPSSAQRGRRR